MPGSTRRLRAVGFVNVKAVVKTLHAVQATVAAAALQVPRRHLIAIAAAIVILVALAWWVPIPNALELRDWAT